MKITFFRHSLYNRGGDKIVIAYANYLAASGHQVCIRTSDLSTIFTIDPRIDLAKLKYKSKPGTILTALAEKLDADVVVADIIVLASILFFRNRHKVIYFAQDYDESYYSSAAMKLFIRFCYVLGLSVFGIPAIAVSESLARKLRKFRSRTAVVTNGVDRSVFFPDPSEKLNREKQGRKALLALARSDRRKGFDIIPPVIESIVAETIHSIEIWTVGERAEGVFPGHVHRDFGYVGEAELRVLMSSADLFLYPSRHEGFGLMVMEAFACRCPVVTTDSVPFAEDMVNALVCKLDDRSSMVEKAVRLLQDNELARRLADNGYELARSFSRHSSACLFEEILKKELS